MPTLFDIEVELRRWNDHVEETGGEIADPLAEGIIEDWFNSIAAERAKKLDGYLYLIRQLESEAAAAKAMVEQFAKKQRSRESRVAYLKEMLKGHMERTGVDKLHTAEGFTVSIVRNGGNAPIEFLVPVDHLPDDLCKIERKPDLNKIRHEIKLSDSSSELTRFPYAVEGERGTHLRIS